MNKKDFGYNTDCCCLTDREINQILMKENQALKDRWEKFKEWVNSDSVGDADDGYHWVIRLDNILEKMKELEYDVEYSHSVVVKSLQEYLAEHDKQVKKQICNEILLIIDEKFNCCGYVEEKFEDIKKYVLDRIQGSEE